ncbi:MAG: sulfatase [Pirellulaceae bacterium]|nr:sulfatase [Pirellulaceae bacterium]
MNRASLVLAAFVIAWVLSLAGLSAAQTNILFIIADDASLHFGQAYDCDWVRTPNIDRLARNGLVFDNAYTPTAKCAPSRSAILTGRNPWQLEDAANHQSQFPVKFVAFSEALSAAGIRVGGQGKIWGPGSALTADGQPRSFGFNVKPQENFASFLKSQPSDKPFFYWYGSKNPHRPYDKDSGTAAGKQLSDIDRVPRIWPDNQTVRGDMLDYALEVEAFDDEVGQLLDMLLASDRADNTLVIVTSDNGMPFPRAKGHNYDISNREPLVMYWPEGIVRPGRRLVEFVSFTDFAPTFLELMGVDGLQSGMSPITGRSLVSLLQGHADPTRDFVILGRERNDVQARPGTPSGLGYPIRAMRSGDWFYIHNFAPDRWPCGDIELGLLDTDNSPTKRLIRDFGEHDQFWQLAFGKRPQEELYHLTHDPDCIVNLAADAAHSSQVASLREQLFAELTRQSDPRVLGSGNIFDNYQSPRANTPPPASRK